MEEAEAAEEAEAVTEEEEAAAAWNAAVADVAYSVRLRTLATHSENPAREKMVAALSGAAPLAARLVRLSLLSRMTERTCTPMMVGRLLSLAALPAIPTASSPRAVAIAQLAVASDIAAVARTPPPTRSGVKK